MAASQGTLQQLNAGLISRLPLELQDAVLDNVPVVQQARMRARETAQRNRIIYRPQDPTADPEIPPSDGSSPFLKLPAEIRRIVFVRFLLPDKSKTVSPNALGRRQQEQRRYGARFRERRQQQHFVHAGQAALQAPGYWNQQLQIPPSQIHGQPPPVPPNTWVPHISNGMPAAVPFGQIAPPAGFAGPHVQTPIAPNFPQGVQIAGQPIHPQPIGPPPHPSNVPFLQSNAGAPFTLQSNIGQVPAGAQSLAPVLLAPPNAWAAAYQASVGPAAWANNGPPTLSASPVFSWQDRKRKYYPSAAEDDRSPSHIAITLLLINKQLMQEVSEILYEERKFEIHIYSNGVEILGLDRIPTFENWGADLKTAFSTFEASSHFCYQRMKHLEFVFFGGTPKDRLAGLRMRETARKLIELRQQEKEAPINVKIRFEYELLDKDESKVTVQEDDLGSFWTSKGIRNILAGREHTRYAPRESILHDVTQVELVCAPFRALYGVHHFEIKLPTRLKDNDALKMYAKAMADTVTNLERSNELDDEMAKEQVLADMMREEMMRDARYDKEMLDAGAGGYYKPSDRHEELEMMDTDLVAKEDWHDEPSPQAEDVNGFDDQYEALHDSEMMNDLKEVIISMEQEHGRISKQLDNLQHEIATAFNDHPDSSEEIVAKLFKQEEVIEQSLEKLERRLERKRVELEKLSKESRKFSHFGEEGDDSGFILSDDIYGERLD